MLIHRCSVFPGCCHKHWKKSWMVKIIPRKSPTPGKKFSIAKFPGKTETCDRNAKFQYNPSLLKIIKLPSICFSTQSSNTFLSSYGPVGMLLTLS